MNKNKLFVGNLNYSVNEGQLRTLFSRHGEVISVKVMEGKGYAFVEMGSDEQAEKVRATLSETEFEGRRLLIDGVPSQQGQFRRKPKSAEPRPGDRTSGYRGDTGRRDSNRGPAGKPAEVVRHLTDVTDEFRKKEKNPKKPEKPASRIGQNASPPAPRKDATPPAQGRAADNTKPGKNHPDKPGNRTQDRQQERKPREGEPERRRTGQDKKPFQGKPKKEKEPPHKNPNPWQGSKKAKSPAKQTHESERNTEEPADNERQKYLRYWATLAGKK